MGSGLYGGRIGFRVCTASEVDAMTKQTKQITMRLPATVYQDAKDICQIQRRTLVEFVSEAIGAQIERELDANPSLRDLLMAITRARK